MKISQLLASYYGEDKEASSIGTAEDQSPALRLAETESVAERFSENESAFSRIRVVQKKIDALEEQLYSTRHALFTEMISVQDLLSRLHNWSATPTAPLQNAGQFKEVAGLSPLLRRVETVQAVTALRNFRDRVTSAGFLSLADLETCRRYLEITKDDVFEQNITKTTFDHMNVLLTKEDVDLDELAEVIQTVMSLQLIIKQEVSSTVMDWTKKRCIRVLADCGYPTVRTFLEWVNDEIPAAVDFMIDAVGLSREQSAVFLRSTQLEGFGLVDVEDDLTTLLDETARVTDEVRRVALHRSLLDRAERQLTEKIGSIDRLDAVTATAVERQGLETLANFLFIEEDRIKMCLNFSDCVSLVDKYTENLLDVVYRDVSGGKDELVKTLFKLRVERTMRGSVRKQLLSIVASFFGETLGTSAEGPVVNKVELPKNVSSKELSEAWTAVFGAPPSPAVLASLN